MPTSMTKVAERAAAALALGAVVAMGGCHKNEPPAPLPLPPAAAQGPAPTPVAAAPTHVDGTPHTDAVESAWRSAGLPPEGFAALQPIPYGASICEQGRLQGVDATVCEFSAPDALTKGEAALIAQWGREGGHTGVTFKSKLTLVGLVDRGRADPNGKTIHKAIDIFRKL
jgi:hypothetical protein